MKLVEVVAKNCCCNDGALKPFCTEARIANHRAFSAAVADWPAFPDSAQALQRLSQRYQLIILSNVDRASFAGSARRAACRR